MFNFIKTFSIYFFIFYIFSIILNLTGNNHSIPIEKTNAKRIFNIIPLREALLLPPISYIIWSQLLNILKIQKNKLQILFESLIAMFITGFIIHKIFNVKSKLGNIIGITKMPDGT